MKRAAACQQIAVLRKRKSGAVSFPGRGTQTQPRSHLILHMNTGCHKEMMQGTVVRSQSSHQRKLLERSPRIFRIRSSYLLRHLMPLWTVKVHHIATLHIPVPVIVQSGRQFMMCAKLAFIEERGIDIRFIHIVHLVGIIGTLIMIRP